jgi:hypothetical protein
MKVTTIIAAILIGILHANVSAGINNESSEKILNLMEDLLTQVPPDLAGIDPEIKRLAIYKIKIDERVIPPALAVHFKSKLVELLQEIEPPTLVSLPELNTLKISSTDTSFSIINALPSPNELWRIGRNLRVDAFVEGELSYVADKALFLDLRLNRTGTNEVLWARSYSAYENIKVGPSNPLYKTLNTGIELFSVDINSDPADSLVSRDFNNRLSVYTVALGIYQYTSAASRWRYEVKAGISFMSSGVQLHNTQFSDNAFYSVREKESRFANPLSYNFTTALYSTLLPNHHLSSGDWLSVYFSFGRYFTKNTPDLTSFGAGLRSDLSSKFAASVGFSIILSSEFNSVPIESTGLPVRMKIGGVHWDFLLLQFVL